MQISQPLYEAKGIPPVWMKTDATASADREMFSNVKHITVYFSHCNALFTLLSPHYIIYISP